jgi:hypothetical protein
MQHGHDSHNADPASTEQDAAGHLSMAGTSSQLVQFGSASKSSSEQLPSLGSTQFDQKHLKPAESLKRVVAQISPQSGAEMSGVD